MEECVFCGCEFEPGVDGDYDEEGYPICDDCVEEQLEDAA